MGGGVPEPIPFDGIAIRLLDVRLAGIRGEVRDKPNSELPDWVQSDGDTNGNLQIMGVNDNVLIQFSARIVEGQLALSITLQGLYEVAPESTVLLPRSADRKWVVQRIPDAYKKVLIDQGTRDLYPYLRHLAVTVSSQMDATSRLVLAPRDEWDLLKIE